MLPQKYVLVAQRDIRRPDYCRESAFLFQRTDIWHIKTVGARADTDIASKYKVDILQTSIIVFLLDESIDLMGISLFQRK